jgi:type I restriction-modification system DNA methylase subunit
MLYSLQGHNENYLGVVEKYDNDQPDGQRPADLYSQAFGDLQRGLAETDADLLGVVYEELGMDSDAFGQYFTPHNICDAKAEMVVDFDDDRDEPYTIADPASGSGRLLIYAARNIPDKVDAVFYGQDKDSTCAKMTALNLCFFNMDGYAVHGDSLTMEKHRVWQTRKTMLGGDVKELEESGFPEIDHEAVRQIGKQTHHYF